MPAAIYARNACVTQRPNSALGLQLEALRAHAAESHFPVQITHFQTAQSLDHSMAQSLTVAMIRFSCSPFALFPLSPFPLFPFSPFSAAPPRQGSFHPA